MGPDGHGELMAPKKRLINRLGELMLPSVLSKNALQYSGTGRVLIRRFEGLPSSRWRVAKMAPDCSAYYHSWCTSGEMS